MKRIPIILLVLICSLFAVTAATNPNDEKDAQAAALKLFDLMAAKDGEGIKALFGPEAQLLAVIKRPDGKSVNRTLTAEAFATSIAGNKGTLKEVMPSPEVKLSGDLALVWGRYVFILDGKLSHCGVNSFHMVRTTDGWKIGNAATTIDPGSCTEDEKKLVAKLTEGK